MRGSIRALRPVEAMDAVKRYFRSPAAVAGLILLLTVIAMAISAGFLYPRDPLALAGRPLIWPFSNPRFLLGTDNSGRDIAAQIFYGARISLLIGGVATAIAILIGILVGAFAGYAGVVMAVAILLESALAVLRLSDPSVASWGNLIGLGRDVLRVQWYVSAIPGIAILVTVLAVSLVGQGLNDALNPRLKGR